MTRPAAGVITRRPEEPYVNSTSTVLWELGGGNSPRLPDEVAARVVNAVSARLPADKGFRFNQWGREVGPMQGRRPSQQEVQR